MVVDVRLLKELYSLLRGLRDFILKCKSVECEEGIYCYDKAVLLNKLLDVKRLLKKLKRGEVDEFSGEE